MSQVFKALKQDSGAGRELIDGVWEAPENGFQRCAPPCQSSVEHDTDIASSGVPMLDFERHPEHRLICLDGANSQGAENIRILSARLKYLKAQSPFGQLMVSSSVSGEGKSMIAANLAITLATREQERTLLIDGDLSRGSLTRIFNASTRPGMVEWLRTGRPVNQYLTRLDDSPLFFLPAGQRAGDCSLRAERLTQLLASCKEAFEWIVVDCPPLTFLADASTWALALEKCLIVARAGVAPKRLLQKTIASLPPAKLIGVVLNECTDVSHSYYERYYDRNA